MVRDGTGHLPPPGPPQFKNENESRKEKKRKKIKRGYQEENGGGKWN